MRSSTRCAWPSRREEAVAYPNGGGGVGLTDADLGWSLPDVDPDSRSWVSAGAAYVGGCCRVGPAEIARLAVALDADRRPS